MHIAIQQQALRGETLHEQCAQARACGADGIELALSVALAENLPAVAAALTAHGLRASAVNAGHTRLIHPEPSVREHELVRLREAMAIAVDLGAQGVIFMGHYAPGAVLPDLLPYKTAQELEAELLITMLRTTLCDHAYAMGTQLLLEPASAADTHLIRQVRHASLVRQRLNNPAELRICANWRYMQAEGEALEPTLAAHGAEIGYLRLPADLPNTAGLVAALRAAGYDGWLCVEGDAAAGEGVASAVRDLRVALTDA